MNLVKPSVEIIEQGNSIMDMYKHITKCGYTCYKTEKEITDEVATAFVQRMKDSKHTAMLEHGTVYLAVPLKTYKLSSKVREQATGLLSLSVWSRWFRAMIDGAPYLIIVTNYRVIFEHHLEDFMERFWWDNPHNKAARVTVKFTIDTGVSHELVRHKILCVA